MGVSSNRRKSTSGRKRTKYTPEQLEVLENAFTQSQYPDTETLEKLTDELDVSIEKISVWFQNRRSKFKRDSRDSNVSWMRKQFYTSDHLSQKRDTRHVLSPAQLSRTTDSTAEKPSSNLHYLPEAASIIPPLNETSQSPSSSPFHPSPSSPYSQDAKNINQSNSSFLSHFLNNSAALYMPYQFPSHLQHCNYFVNSFSNSHTMNEVPFHAW